MGILNVICRTYVTLLQVSRIILAVFRNLIEKPEEAEVRKENCISMYQCKVNMAVYQCMVNMAVYQGKVNMMVYQCKVNMAVYQCKVNCKVNWRCISAR